MRGWTLSFALGAMVQRMVSRKPARGCVLTWVCMRGVFFPDVKNTFLTRHVTHPFACMWRMQSFQANGSSLHLGRPLKLNRNFHVPCPQKLTPDSVPGSGFFFSAKDSVEVQRGGDQSMASPWSTGYTTPLCFHWWAKDNSRIQAVELHAHLNGIRCKPLPLIRGTTLRHPAFRVTLLKSCIFRGVSSNEGTSVKAQADEHLDVSLKGRCPSAWKRACACEIWRSC